MNSIFVLNTLVLIGIIAAAIMAVTFDRLFPSIIALGAAGLFLVFEFILLHAPDVAIAEAAVGVVLAPVIFVITLRKVKGGRQE